MSALEAPTMPSCPTCGLNENVTKDHFGQKHLRHAYLCGSCWALFSGSQDEWQRNKDHRELHHKRQENRGTHS